MSIIKEKHSDKVMIGIKDIMSKMGIGRDSAYMIIKRKEFHAIKIGRRYLVHEEVFDRWLKEGK
ncbi:helix-turn-helix domain-containing protein [Paenibacillus sp. FSL E2-0178]|uniref:helix-turn-helix domain-containing protein n=1 Tax=Paenibacillus sp. FSL E2-0178 TaxID=2921361 RepID=UPI0031595E6F